MKKSILSILTLSILIHVGLLFFKKRGFFDSKNVVSRSETAEKAFDLGYQEGYHRATEDMAELNKTPEHHN
jgi:hypothetical protein